MGSRTAPAMTIEQSGEGRKPYQFFLILGTGTALDVVTPFKAACGSSNYIIVTSVEELDLLELANNAVGYIYAHGSYAGKSRAHTGHGVELGYLGVPTLIKTKIILEKLQVASGGQALAVEIYACYSGGVIDEVSFPNMRVIAHGTRSQKTYPAVKNLFKTISSYKEGESNIFSMFLSSIMCNPDTLKISGIPNSIDGPVKQHFTSRLPVQLLPKEKPRDDNQVKPIEMEALKKHFKRELIRLFTVIFMIIVPQGGVYNPLLPQSVEPTKRSEVLTLLSRLMTLLTQPMEREKKDELMRELFQPLEPTKRRALKTLLSQSMQAAKKIKGLTQEEVEEYNQYIAILIDKRFYWTDMMGMAELNDIEGLRHLLSRPHEAENQINAVSFQGRTALMFAAYRGYFPIVEMLIQSNATASLRDNEGNTALTYAQKRLEVAAEPNKKEDYQKIVELLCCRLSRELRPVVSGLPQYLPPRLSPSKRVREDDGAVSSPDEPPPPVTRIRIGPG